MSLLLVFMPTPYSVSSSKLIMVYSISFVKGISSLKVILGKFFNLLLILTLLGFMP